MNEQVGVNKYTQEIESEIKRLDNYITKVEDENKRLKRIEENLHFKIIDLRITISNLKDLIKWGKSKSLIRLKYLERELSILESLYKGDKTVYQVYIPIEEWQRLKRIEGNVEREIKNLETYSLPRTALEQEVDARVLDILERESLDK